MSDKFYPIAAAASMLAIPEDTLRRLAASRIVDTRLQDGELLIDVAEAAVTLGADISEPDTLETASLALAIRRIKKLDIEIQQKQLEYNARIGQVIPVETVRQERLKRIRTVRTVLLALPSAIAYRLADKPIDVIQKALTDEVLRILAVFAGGEGSVESAGSDLPERVREEPDSVRRGDVASGPLE